MVDDYDNMPTNPEDVLRAIEKMQQENRKSAAHLARLKMWAQVALQTGITADKVRCFSTREEHIKDSYGKWLKARRKDNGTASAWSMGRASMIGMVSTPRPEDPEWTRHCGKDRNGRYTGTVYTVVLLKDGTERRLDPPIVAPDDE